MAVQVCCAPTRRCSMVPGGPRRRDKDHPKMKLQNNPQCNIKCTKNVIHKLPPSCDAQDTAICWQFNPKEHTSQQGGWLVWKAQFIVFLSTIATCIITYQSNINNIEGLSLLGWISAVCALDAEELPTRNWGNLQHPLICSRRLVSRMLLIRFSKLFQSGSTSWSGSNLSTIIDVNVW